MSSTLRTWIARIEDEQALDEGAKLMSPLAEKASAGQRGAWLRGEWLGHAFHPLLTDIPIGCWTSSMVLDLIGGKGSRRASQRLVGIGLAAVPLTVASGLADWNEVSDKRTGRVGVAHALGNAAVSLLYLSSWRSRRRGHHVRGVLVGLAGGALATVTGYLGGHMSFARGAGVGERGAAPADARQLTLLDPNESHRRAFATTAES